MKPPPRRVLAHCSALFAALALALGGCAGAGHAYGCDPDAGECHGNPFSDGGTTVSTFVSSAVTVWHDGMHNSDIDVVAFNGALFGVFRHASTFTVSATASLYIVTSTDSGATWAKSAELVSNPAADAGPGLDLREPKLSVFQGALHVTVTAWDPTDPDDHVTTVLAASSSDGVHFSQLLPAGLVSGSEAWRPRQVSESLWISAWKADELFPNDAPGGLSLYASLDGQSFNGAVSLPVGPGAHQGELLVRSDNTLWIAIPERQESDSVDQQTICHTPIVLPYNFTCWSVAQAPIDSPALFEFDGVLLLLGGHALDDGRGRTAIWQVDDGAQSFDLIADLPQSEGETGDPSIVGLDSSHALISYHTTSTLDPRVQALGHEPTTLESESDGFAVDIDAVVLNLDQVPAGD